LPAGKVGFPTRRISLESGASWSSQLLSCYNQAGIPFFDQEKPKPGKIQRHEEIIDSKSDNSENSKLFLSTSQLLTKDNPADISETQPSNYNEAINFNINLKAENCLQRPGKTNVYQEILDHEESSDSSSQHSRVERIYINPHLLFQSLILEITNDLNKKLV
jgi:hypothetical protein